MEINNIRLDGSNLAGFDIRDMQYCYRDAVTAKDPQLIYYKSLPPDARVRVHTQSRDDHVICIYVFFQIDRDTGIDTAAQWLYEKLLPQKDSYVLSINNRQVEIDDSAIKEVFEQREMSDQA